jgi:CRISPR-associated endonuclease Cas1
MTIDKIADGDLDGTPEQSGLNKNADQDDTEWADRSAYWQQQAIWRPRRPKQKRKVRSPLVLGGHGVRLRIDGGSLFVQNGFTHYPQKREEWRFFPGHPDLPSRIVVVDGDGGLTFDVLAWLSTQQIPLIQINWRGEAIVVGGASGYVVDFELMQAQRAAHASKRHTMAISRWLIAEKITACGETLLRVTEAGPARERALQEIAGSMQALTTQPAQTLDGLRGIEGRVAQAYFAAWRSMPLRWKSLNRKPVPEEWLRIGARTPPNSKRNRNATHPVNAMLNYGLAVLESRVRLAVTAAGLDSTIGYMHAQHEGRSALVLDMMEPLRPAADRVVLAFVQGQALSPADFIVRDDGLCRLAPQLARTVAAKTMETVEPRACVGDLIARLDGPDIHPRESRGPDHEAVGFCDAANFW